MDQRQTQIREGAGLEESRLNVEFIDLLRKWSSPVLLVAAVLAFGYWGWQKLQESRLNRLNAAFRELDAVSAVSSPSPDSLRGVAAEYGDVRAVGTLARLEAADVYLRAVRLGVLVGAQPEADEAGQFVFKPADILTDADRARYLADAELLYQQVVDDNRGKPGMTALHTMAGLYGLAAIAESREDLAKAKSFYEEVSLEAQRAGLDGHVAVAKDRIAGLEALKTLPKVYNAADLPKPPAPPEPVLPLPSPTPDAGVDAGSAPDGDAGDAGQEGADAPAGEPEPAPSDQPPADPAPDEPPADPAPDQPK